MGSRVRDLEINLERTIQQKMDSKKVLVVVLDGPQQKARIFEAVEHGQTIIETAKGRTAKIRFEESELF